MLILSFDKLMMKPDLIITSGIFLLTSRKGSIA
jgi:hypothetical protein